jgi:hypothetical protein
MSGSTAGTPETPEFLRASDAERDHAVSELRNEFVEGRLSHETFVHRMHSALGARNRGQLAGLFQDLPPRRPGLMTRIRAALRSEARAAPDGQPDPGWGIPGTQKIVGPAYGPGPPEASWGEPGRHAPVPPPPLAAAPAPLCFPRGRGVRFTIGRTRECDLCLTDLSVSRMHALLIRREDGWVLSDLGSHNGTRLNGWLVREPVTVHPGDRVEFGSMAFIIQPEPPAPAPAAEQEEEEEEPEPGPGPEGKGRRTD